ncbi:Uncharacterised protein [Turicibacter sanguinis]|nr:Uncharacterised protein [Turicibacter sanguinis]
MSVNTGLKVTDYIIEDSSTGLIVVKNEMFHDSYTQRDYEEFLEELIEDEQMEQTTFKENKWVLFGEFGEKRHIRFSFEFNPQFNNLLKKFVLFKFKVQNVTSGQVGQLITAIVRIAQKTNFFNINHLADFTNEVRNFEKSELIAAMFTREFLRFAQIPNGEQYYDALKHVPTPTYGSRALPSYKSIMTFDYIINDFILNSSEELKLKYYPVLIWWQLTKIVPLRPIELSILQRDWLYKKNGSYFIKIERRKKRQSRLSSQGIPPLTEIEISEEVFHLIHHYIQLGKEFNNSPYILDYEFAKHNLNQIIRINKSNVEYSTHGFLNRNLRIRFFEEIVQNQYGYTVVPKQEEELDYLSNEIEVIHLGDTRHIAICSMMLQGMNEYTIAQMAGHHNLTEQIGYCNHLESYATAYTHRMAKSIQDTLQIDIGGELEAIELAEKQQTARALLLHSSKPIRRINNGYCKSKNFPFECEIDDCLFCPHFVPGRDMSQELLEQKAEMLEHQIKTKLEYIKSVVENSRKNDFKDNAELRTNARSLNADMYRKARIDALRTK